MPGRPNRGKFRDAAKRGELLPGQRPPFQTGNVVGVTHGAYSPSTIGERATEVRAQFLRDHPQYNVPELSVWVGMLARCLAREQLAHEAVEDGNLSPRLIEVAATTVSKAHDILKELGNGLRSAAELRDIQAKTALTIATLAQQAPVLLDAIRAGAADIGMADRTDDLVEAIGARMARIAGAD